MRPESSQPARLHAPKVDRTGTATYNNTELTGEYLCPLACSEYKTNNCLKFPDMLKALPPLQRDEKYVSWGVDALFTTIKGNNRLHYS